MEVRSVDKQNVYLTAEKSLTMQRLEMFGDRIESAGGKSAGSCWSSIGNFFSSLFKAIWNFITCKCCIPSKWKDVPQEVRYKKLMELIERNVFDDELYSFVEDKVNFDLANLEDEKRNTPIYYVNSKEMVTVLINMGANPSIFHPTIFSSPYQHHLNGDQTHRDIAFFILDEINRLKRS